MALQISYDLWPIWCDYLEEQGQDTELLRYVLTWGIFVDGYFLEHSFTCNSGIGYDYKYNHGNSLYYIHFRLPYIEECDLGNSIFEDGCLIIENILETKYYFGRQ